MKSQLNKTKINDCICDNQSNSNSSNKVEKLKLCIDSMSQNQKYKFWIKTLISSYKTIPKIIQAIDKIIELQASSVSFTTNIFNKKNTTMSQVENVIDLTERKSSLLNIYVMTKNMLSSLSEEHFEFIEKKYIYDWSNEELSNYYSISIRTVYRKVYKIIDEICAYSIKKNWSFKFIENQIKNEGWLKDKYSKLINEYFKNNNYKLS